MKVAPIPCSHVFRRTKISLIIFEKGHSRNISVNLFQNLTSGFWEEDFLRISSCPYSAKSPHSPEPCLWTDQNFANNFLKKVTKETFLWNYFKIWPAVSEKIFLRISSCPYSAKSPHLPEPCLLMEQISRTIFEKGCPRNISVKSFQIRTSGLEEKIFNNFFMSV